MNMNLSDGNPRPRVRWKLWFGLGGVLLGLGLVYSVLWLVIANLAMNYLNLWAEDQRQSGYAVRWDSAEISGYPFRIIATLDKPLIDGPAHGATHRWAWAVDVITLSGKPWSWNTLHLNMPGHHTLIVSGAATETTQTITFDAESLSVDTEFQGDRWRHVTASGSDIRIQQDGRLVLELARFSSVLNRDHTPPAHDVDEQTRTGALHLSLNDLAISVLGDQLVRVAGSIVRYASLNVEAYGPLPDGPSPSSLALWRDAGGVVEVRQVRADYGPLSLDAEGALALDGRLQPVGSFVARVQGFSETVDALYGAGMITDGDVLTAKLVLGALAKKDAITGKSHLSIPVNIQDRTIFAGPLTLVKLPPIRW